MILTYIGIWSKLGILKSREAEDWVKDIKHIRFCGLIQTSSGVSLLLTLFNMGMEGEKDIWINGKTHA